MERIGFIGLGKMGGNMAARYLAGGYTVHGKTESAIGSPMLKARVPLVLDKPNETWFDVELMHKDIRLARQAGDELDSPTPSAALADHILDRASQLGYEHRDIAAIHEVLAQDAGDRSMSAGSAPSRT
jgi:3-hydroxyisobutyrate dehydrogenase-like beta-hydroxyacid dehydrogenase